jgi:hypothetical protein
MGIMSLRSTIALIALGLSILGCAGPSHTGVTPLPSRVSEAEAVRIARSYAQSLGRDLSDYPGNVVHFDQQDQQWHVLFTHGTGTNEYWGTGVSMSAFGTSSSMIIP